MRGIRARIVLGVAALAAGVLLASVWFAGRGLETPARGQAEASLRARTALVQELVGGRPIVLSARETLQPLAVRAAAAAGARVTLIADDGTVVADSGLTLPEFAHVENHAARPEVRAAIAGEPRFARRRSRTLHRPFLYFALPTAAGQGVVRLALDQGDVEAYVAALWRRLVVAALLALALSIALAFGLSELALRPVRELGRVVDALAEGDLDPRLRWRGGGELGRIASGVNRLADQLRGRLREVTGEKEQLQAVLSGMVEGVLVVDPKDRVVLANPRLRELFGAWGDVEGRLHWEVIRRPELEETLQRAAESPEPAALELALGDADGTVLQMHAVRFPSRGALRGIVAVFHDVTELRRLEGMRRDFVANVSHELKTPLTAIRGFAETLRSEEISSEQRAQYLEVILRHADRLSHLIEDLLELSRIESRKLVLEASDLDVGRVVETLLRDLRPQLEARSLHGSLVVDGEPVARADRRALEQVLANLLENAVKYSEPGGRIEVRLLAREPQLCVEVEDSGIGIPEADLPRIFERFYRVDKARSRDLGGTGLGLSIVKHLVQALGGEVFVRSRAGEGSTFAFTLPRPPAD